MKNGLRNLIVFIIVAMVHLLVGIRLFWRPSPPSAAVQPPAAEMAPAPVATPDGINADAPVPPATPTPTPVTPQPATPATPATPTTPVRRPSPQVPAASAFPAYHRGFYREALRPMPEKLRRSLNDVRAGVAIDVASRSILWEKSSDKAYPIASLTKLLTAQMLIEKVDSDPSLTMQSVLKVTNDDVRYLRARRISGVYLDPRDKLTFSEFVKCMIISSANDCAAIAGKFIGGGDIEEGVVAMNHRARQLGLSGMQFYNPNGLPIDRAGGRVENLGSALDVAYLTERSLGFPEIMKWAAVASDCIREDTKRFDLHSTNKLLRARVPGVNGLKTGYTATAGYCISVTCTRNGRTVIIVLMGVQGADNGRHRDALAKSLLEWIYAGQ